jgi:hypothetical protein
MKNLLIFFFGLFLFASCNSTDLIVLPRPGQEDRTDNEAFCNIDGNDLVVRVKNVGTSDAPPVDVIVEFHSSTTSQIVTTPPIPGLTEVEVRVTIPPGCFDPDCSYRITVDPNNLINEVKEDNNVQEAICIG